MVNSKSTHIKRYNYGVIMPQMTLVSFLEEEALVDCCFNLLKQTDEPCHHWKIFYLYVIPARFLLNKEYLAHV
jgi:hypothetical protein